MRSAVLAAVVLALAVAASPAGAASQKCGGLFRVTKQDGSATLSVAVHNLRQIGTTCTRAKHIARVAAKAVLDKSVADLPKTIDGFRVSATGACGGCAPQYPVVARKGAASVRFTLYGGG